MLYAILNHIPSGQHQVCHGAYLYKMHLSIPTFKIKSSNKENRIYEA